MNALNLSNNYYGPDEKICDFQEFNDFLNEYFACAERRCRAQPDFSAKMVLGNFCSIRTAVLEATPYEISCGRNMPKDYKKIPLFNIVSVQKGHIHVLQNGEGGVIEPDGVVLIDWRSEIHLKHDVETLITIISIPQDVWTKFSSPPPPPENGNILKKTAITTRLIREFSHQIALSGDEMSGQQGETIVRQFIELVSLAINMNNDQADITINKKNRISNIKIFIRNQISNPNLSLSLVSEKFGVSSRYISKLFCDSGHTMMDYVWDLRLQRAAELIEINNANNFTVKEIAFATGFVNPSHFSRKFVEKYGVGPKDYRSATAHRTA